MSLGRRVLGICQTQVFEKYCYWRWIMNPNFFVVFVFPFYNFVILSPTANFKWPPHPPQHPQPEKNKQDSWKVCLNFLILLILTCYNLITETDFLYGPPIKSLSSWNKPEILLNNKASIHLKLLRIYTETVECLFWNAVNVPRGYCDGLILPT